MRVEDMSAVKSCVGKPAMLTVSSLSAAIPTGKPVAWAMAASMSSAAVKCATTRCAVCLVGTGIPAMLKPQSYCVGLPASGRYAISYTC